MKKIEENGETYTKKDHEELIKLCEQFLNGDNSPEANKLRTAVMRWYDKWDDDDEDKEESIRHLPQTRVSGTD